MKKITLFIIIAMLGLSLAPAFSSASGKSENKKSGVTQGKSEEYKQKSRQDKEDRTESEKKSGKYSDDDHEGDDDDDDDENERHRFFKNLVEWGGSKVTICHKGKVTISISERALRAHRAHGDTDGRCTGGDNATTTPPTVDVIPPVITSVAGTVAVNGAVVSWTTNELSTSRVWYATSSNVATATPRFDVSNNGLVTSHTLTLEGLTASTTYFFTVSSVDASGNSATSSTYFFKTNPLIISGLSATSSASTTASISWNTNDETNGTLWYATSSPVISAFTPVMMSTTTLSTSHTFALENLIASTSYYYFVMSADLFGNTATSSDGVFVTGTE